MVLLGQPRNWYALFIMRAPLRWPTPWFFSLLILPLGMYVGFIWTALPYLLSKAGVPVEQTARVGALLQLPAILMFLWTPIVDIKLRRRTWLLLGASVTALCLWAACSLLGPSHLQLLTAFLLAGGGMVALVMTSCGGLMVAMLSAPAKAKASGWILAGNRGTTGCIIIGNGSQNGISD
jgi:hypothetical protein